MFLRFFSEQLRFVFHYLSYIEYNVKALEQNCLISK